MNVRNLEGRQQRIGLEIARILPSRFENWILRAERVEKKDAEDEPEEQEIVESEGGIRQFWNWKAEIRSGAKNSEEIMQWIHEFESKPLAPPRRISLPYKCQISMVDLL